MGGGKVKIVDKRSAEQTGLTFEDLKDGDWFEWTGEGTINAPCLRLGNSKYCYFNEDGSLSNGGASYSSGPIRKLTATLVIEDAQKGA